MLLVNGTSPRGDWCLCLEGALVFFFILFFRRGMEESENSPVLWGHLEFLPGPSQY